MRSLTSLQIEAESRGLTFESTATREQLMDLLSFKDDASTDLQIDPMKAKDLKKDLDWGRPNPLDRIKKYLTGSYVVEPKLDGVRMRMHLGSTHNRLTTGRRSDITYAYIERTHNFPHLRDAVVAELEGTVLDGELLAPRQNITTESGTVTHSWLNASVALANVNPADAVRTQLREGPATFHVFDILYYKGMSVQHRPLVERRAILKEVQTRVALLAPEIELLDQQPATADQIEAYLLAGYEGAMIKSKVGPYQAGKRSAHWLKVKKMSTGDAFITGWLPGEGRNLGLVGAVKVSVKDENGLDIEIGQPGAFTDEFRAALTAPDGSLATEWYGKVIEVMAQGRTKNGRLRHPHMVRLRPDKTEEDCTLEAIQDEFMEV